MRPINPTLRGFAVIVAVAAVATAFSLQPGLVLVMRLLQIAFLVAVVWLLYGLWRRHRSEIAVWPTRPRTVFYGALALAIVNLVGAFVLRSYPSSGLEALVFLAVLAAAGYAMWRTWQEQHSYGSF